MVNHKKKIFFVDDEPQLRRIVQRTIERYGYEVVCFGDSVSCLDELVFGDCDLLITDVNMPGINGIELLEKHDVIKEFEPDVILYDVLGDVVCGGFAMPIRNGYARDVFVVTSGEMMSLYAASNIAEAVRGFEGDGYARLRGLIQNSRNVVEESELIDRAAAEMSLDVIFRLKRDPVVQECEAKGMTVVEGAPDSEMATAYRRLSEKFLSLTEDADGGMRF